jgi:hypothetical protein
LGSQNQRVNILLRFRRPHVSGFQDQVKHHQSLQERAMRGPQTAD